MRLPGFDVVFGLAAPAIDVFVEHASVAFVQIGDDEARVRSFRARFDAGDDPLDPAPALRAVEELLETTKLAVSGRGFEPCLYAGFETFDMPAQRRSRRDAEDVIEAARPTPVENLGAAVVAVGAQKDLGVGPMGSDRAQQPAEEGFDLLAARPLGGTKHGGDEAALAVALSRQISIGDFRRRIRPSAPVIREQKQWSSSPPWCASRQYRIYSDNARRGTPKKALCRALADRSRRRLGDRSARRRRLPSGMRQGGAAFARTRWGKSAMARWKAGGVPTARGGTSSPGAARTVWRAIAARAAGAPSTP